MCGALMMSRPRFMEMMVQSSIGCDFELSLLLDCDEWIAGSIKKILEAEIGMTREEICVR